MVRVENALVAPYRCICRIVARAYDKPENEYSVGTGFLISPYYVLTCAHNIYPLQAPRTKTIDVYPAQNGPDERRHLRRAALTSAGPRTTARSTGLGARLHQPPTLAVPVGVRAVGHLGAASNSRS